MALMGFVENFLPERIQILAQTELTYLATLSREPTCDAAIDRLFQFSMPLIVVCKGLDVPPHLIQRANQGQVPVLRTPMSTTPFIHSLTLYLDHMFAPQVTGARLAGRRLRLRPAVHRSQRDRQVRDRARSGRARPPAGGGRRGDDHQAARRRADRHRQPAAPAPHGDPRARHHRRAGDLRHPRDPPAEARRGRRSSLRSGRPTEDYERVGLDERKTEILGVSIPFVRCRSRPARTSR